MQALGTIDQKYEEVNQTSGRSAFTRRPAYKELEMNMKNTQKFALLGALALAFAGPAMAQSGGGAAGGGGGNSGGPNSATGDPEMSASAPLAMHKKGSGGTTLHQMDKKSRLHGASAAAAASALGTNDKGAPH